MEKLNTHSPDFTARNVAKLAELFPNCVTESKDDKGNLRNSIDFDLLKQELSADIVEGPKERYRLDWPGKREALVNGYTPINKTLRPSREESVDFDNTENLFIESDNLDALKLLEKTHLDKVKLVYIDPPYNTGNDILYKNDYSDTGRDYLQLSGQKDEKGLIMIANTESNGRFHSNWLSMMYPRLKLARNLLRKDGIIAISIDHNELNTLTSICDEIFGNENKLGLITVVHKPEGRNQAKFFAPSNEFMLMYSRDINEAVLNKVVIDEDIMATFDRNDDKGKYRLNNYIRFGGGDLNLRKNKPHFFYPIYVSKDMKHITLTEQTNYVKVLPITTAGQERTWKTTKQTFLERYEKGEIVSEKENNGVQIFEKYRETQILKTVWHKPKYHAIHHGTNLVSKLIGENFFDFPKSLNLIVDILKITTSPDDIVLDFFAGSSTTAHAVMQLNAEDASINSKQVAGRKFIMVQLPEKCDEKSEALKAGYENIAEISKERIRRAGEKIKEDNAELAADLDIGFRVLKMDSSNMVDVEDTPDVIEQGQLQNLIENIKPDRTSEDLLFQVLLNWGVDLTLPITTETVKGLEVFFVDKNALVACFERPITEELCKELATHKPLRVVFRDSGFENDSVKVNVEQIFKLLSPDTEVKTI